MSSIASLESWFGKTSKVLVALSAGVDSCRVGFLSRKFLGKTFAPAVISVSASLKNQKHHLGKPNTSQKVVMFLK